MPPSVARAPLPLEIGRRVPPAELELQVLDGQVGRAHDDERAGEDDDDVDAVRQRPSAPSSRGSQRGSPMPNRAKRERDARRAPRRRRRAASARDQLLRARVHRRAVLGADDLERAEQPVDRPTRRDADDARPRRANAERRRRQTRRRSGSAASEALDLQVVGVGARQVGADADEHDGRAGRHEAARDELLADRARSAESTFSPMSVHTGTTPQ